MRQATNGMMETAIYGLSETAQYLRVPLNTLRYWVQGGGSVPPLVRLAKRDPSRLSFMNLLECHMLSSMRAIYEVKIPKVRKALIILRNMSSTSIRWWSKHSRPTGAIYSSSIWERL